MSANQLTYEAEAALDWLTVTTTRPNHGNTMLDLYNRYKTGDGTPATFFGFECMRDEVGLMWGKRNSDARYILIAPGKAAAVVFQKLTPLPVKVTRIDVATDVWLEKSRDQVRQSSRVPLSSAYDSRSRATLITGTGGSRRNRVGDTLYIGSRQSTQFGRMYDKGLQTKTAPVGKWFRYEVQYAGTAAVSIAEVARALVPAALGEWAKCTVFDWFLKRGVAPLFRPQTDTPGAVVRSQYKQTTADKKLAWLKTQVAPTVKYLFEQGLRGELLDALGIELARVDTQGYTVRAVQKLESLEKQAA